MWLSRPFMFLSLLSFTLLIVTATGKHEVVPILKTNPFRENLNKNFSWEDPLLQSSLWKGIERSHPKPKWPSSGQTITYSLRKRVPNAPGGAPLYRAPACSCPNKRPAGTNQYDFSNPDYLESKILTDKIKENCVFYAQRPFGVEPKSWSEAAEKYVCDSTRINDYYALWVSRRRA
jgi:hypothetical protein